MKPEVTREDSEDMRLPSFAILSSCGVDPGLAVFPCTVVTRPQASLQRSVFGHMQQ